MKTYKDKVSGETLYVDSDRRRTKYHKDKAMTVLHRRDGPAVEFTNGDKIWTANGKLHRLDGPAIEAADGNKAWYVNGVIITLILSSGEYKGPRLL